MTFSGVKL